MRKPMSAAQKWIRDPNNLDTYIKLVQASDTAVDSIAEIDLKPHVLTEYEVDLHTAAISLDKNRIATSDTKAWYYTSWSTISATRTIICG